MQDWDTAYIGRLPVIYCYDVCRAGEAGYGTLSLARHAFNRLLTLDFLSNTNLD